MAAALPAALKTADVQRFATRAVQLEKFRPIVTYWCEYYILQQVLSRELHKTDQECSDYAVTLMDKLEAYKQENPGNDAVIDDVAAKTYIENFALDTFTRGDEAQRNNKVTKQTADTFQAAATFMDLLKIWGQVDQEIEAKAKFAKFHALRIAKALKAGEDPNKTNPVVEEPPKPDEDGLDAELRELENQNYQPPTVESAPDSVQPSRPGSTLPMAPPALPSAADVQPEDTYKVSPIEPEQEPTQADTERQRSTGDGYFPSVSADPLAPRITPNAATSPAPPALQQPFTPSDFYAKPTTPANIPPASPAIPSHVTRSIPQTPSVPQTPGSAIMPPPPVVPNPQGIPPGGYKTDDESVLAAQKHAKWAISALNFEDANTAVKELRLALSSLGAR